MILVNMDIQYAGELYPDTCSCGINYEKQGISYKEHLLEHHIVKNS